MFLKGKQNEECTKTAFGFAVRSDSIKMFEEFTFSINKLLMARGFGFAIVICAYAPTMASSSG